MQLTMLTVSVFGFTLLLLQLQVNASPATATAAVIFLPTVRPLCILPPVCGARSPLVCGRTPDGMCRRFTNICHLINASPRDPLNPNRWSHTPSKDCRRVREIGARHAYWCHEECPGTTAICPRTPPDQEICIRSRDHQICKVIANRCQLLNNNCFSEPRNNWRQTDRRRCAEMQLGDKPHPCRRLPSVVVTVKPVVPVVVLASPTPRTSRATTAEPPKDHETTTRRRTTRRS